MSARNLEKSLLGCCHSKAWAHGLLKGAPYSSASELNQSASKTWFALSVKDQRQAYKAHPRIGNIKSLRKKYSATRSLSAREQKGADQATESVLLELKRLNDDYYKKFGFIFIVFATGKSAAQMLRLLKDRLKNSRTIELKNAAAEQDKITRLRLEKILKDLIGVKRMKTITTHVLNTTLGKPGNGIRVELEVYRKSKWKILGSGVTNSDGRVSSLMKSGEKLKRGQYRLRFFTGRYFKKIKRKTFYSKVEICFEVESPNEHYHVPLLISGFGYSTYRGS